MEHLGVYKALGDDTRYALYAELLGANTALSTSELAERLSLHPNTVRPHLERMREVGLLEVDSDSRGTVGRPQHRYRPASGAPGTGPDPEPYQLLAALLAQLVSSGPAGSEEAAAAGRTAGTRLAAAAAGPVRPRRGGPATRPACVAALRALMAQMGFAPDVEGPGIETPGLDTEGAESRATLIFSRCPFRDLAEAHPDVVCHLHRGILEGAAELVGGTEVTEFATLADTRPCRAELALR